MKLTDAACRAAKPREKSYKLFDGDGLYLEIMPSGKKLWRLKFRHLGRESRMSFGAYPLVSLSEAREERHKARKMLHENASPTAVRKSRKIDFSREAQNTFQIVATEWIEQNKDRWSVKHYNRTKRSLENNVYPFIGLRPISQVTPSELLSECLRRVEQRGRLDIAGRIRQTCSQVFRYGIATGRCDRDCAADLRGALKVGQVKHFRTIDSKELPDFIKALERNEARIFERTRRAIWLSLYTFCRPQEIRMARRQDIDFERARWVIPAELMKLRRDHIVPLSRQSVEVLKAQFAETEFLKTDWVFPGHSNYKNPMSDGTVNKALKLLGFGDKMVAHGFRALARTTIREELNFESEVIEKQLAHETGGSLGAAYDRTQFLTKRIEMMQAWADYLEKKAGSNRSANRKKPLKTRK